MMADYIRREDARRMVVQLDKYAWKSPVSDERRVTVDVAGALAKKEAKDGHDLGN